MIGMTLLGLRSWGRSVRRRGIAAALGTLALSVVTVTHAESTSPLAGVWRGPWYLGMTSGTAELILPAAGREGGTLSMTNNENFGAGALPVTDLEAEGGRLRFRVKGEDGKMLTADIPVDGDQPSALKGFARYGGFKLRFEFLRVPSAK